MVTSSKFMDFALTYANCEGWNKNNSKRRAYRFVNFYGVTVEAATTIFNDLCALDEKTNPVFLLMAFRFLAKYKTELELAAEFNYQNEKTARKWAKAYVKKIRSLKASKVRCFSMPLFFLNV